MKNQGIYIVGGILIIISLVMVRNYKSFKTNENSQQYSKQINKNYSKPTIQEKRTPKPTSTNILKFKSSNYDYEDKTDILYTKYETSYHDIDFNNNTITLKAKLGTNSYKTLKYKWSDFNDPYGNGYIEFKIINDKDVYQIWRSAQNNFGYEMRQGTKFVFYGVNQIN